MGVNKVIYGNTPIMDITDTTAEAADVAAGAVFYDRSGTRQVGTGDYMDKVSNPTADDILVTDATGQAVDSGVPISDVVKKTDVATDSDYGIVKTNSSEAISLNANGQLEVGGRLGQFPNGGVFYPPTIEPTNVGSSSFLMTDGAKGLKVSGRTLGIMAGANLTCKSAAAGATQYRLSNTQGNRFACFAGQGGRLALNQADAQANGTALITDISFSNGNPISAYYGPTESDNDIIITVDRTVNPSASTTTLRIYGTSTSNDVIVVGQGCGASGGKAISLGQSCFVGGNQCIAFGNSSISTGNNSVAFGHTHLVNKQFCFAAGQGHDFTNGSNGVGAVGIASEILSDTAFAVGNGTFNANGNIARSNALEVKKDGRVKSSGTPTESDDLTTKAYVDSAISGGGLSITTYGNADFSYERVVDPDTQEMVNECVAYSTVSGNAEEPKAVKYGRIVNMSGAFKNINVRPSNAVFIMGKVPSGCEPLYRQCIMQQGSGQNKYLLTIETDGTLKCARYSTGSAATAVTNNAWLNINATFVAAV